MRYYVESVSNSETDQRQARHIAHKCDNELLIVNIMPTVLDSDSQRTLDLRVRYLTTNSRVGGLK